MAGAVAKGVVSLVVDDLGLEASLRFEPRPDGDDVGAELLAKRLAEFRIAGVPQRRLEDIAAAFAKARGPASEVVATGQAPEPGAPETAEWDEQATPVEFLPFESEAIAAAPPPALWKLRVDRVARERVVKKPGKLPFLPAREEKVVEYEKVEVREPVSVDTQVLKSFWAAKGVAVARLVAPRSGKPGKSVYGKPIPPARDDDPSFYLGRGLSRGKSAIVVEEAGFVRVGQRWADVIPFGGGERAVRLSDDGATALLDYAPGDKRLPPPDASAVLSEALGLGLAEDSLLPVDEIAAALLRASRSGEPLSGFSLSLDRDASAVVRVSEDRLKATLTVLKGRGRGKPLDLGMVTAALAGQKLKGVKVDKLKADVVAFYKGKETDLLDYVLVEGREPGRGKDRTLSFTVAFLPEAQARDYVKAASSHPLLSRYANGLDAFPLDGCKVAIVKKGQEVARLGPPSVGQAGVDVYGVALPGSPGNDPDVKTFENLRVSKESLESDDDGVLFASDADSRTLARVLPYRDAVASVVVDERAMVARVTLEKEYGLGRELSLELAKSALEEAGVVFGVDLRRLSEALAAAREGSPVSGVAVAEGKAPVPAGGVRLNWIVRLATGAALTKRADGSVDFKNQDRSTLVVEGQPLLELKAIGEQGQDGMDVLGLPVKAPKNPEVVEAPTWDATIGEEKTADGDTLLKALKSGELRFEKNRLSVDLSHKIAGDVGTATGNVKFPGPVAVSGSVLTGFALVAAGDVGIIGSVEAALVSSDGAIKIGEGVKGARRGTVRARRTIEASFAEQAMLLAVEDIVLKNSALLCNIKTNGKLTLQGDKGNLVGGLCRARKGIEVQNLGSENGSKTQVSFGQDYLVKDSVEAEEREIERVKLLMLEADRTMRQLEKDGGDLDKVRQDKLKLVKILEKRSLRVFELREKFEEHFPGEIVVRGTVFAGVVIESHNRFHEIRAKKQGVAFSFDPQLGRIVERSLK